MCWVPTWQGWTVALLLAAGGAIGLALTVHPFLAVTRPVATDTLVVEGWCYDPVLGAALQEFQRGGYTRLLVTGGPVEVGGPLSGYRTYAEAGAATLRTMVPSNAPIPVPILEVPAARVDRDRTHSTAVALRQWFDARGEAPARINLVTVGTHARRSRKLFEMAMGPEVEMGIISAADPTYDARRWWSSSAGVRSVLSELIAYAYVALAFHPETPPVEGAEVAPVAPVVPGTESGAPGSRGGAPATVVLEPAQAAGPAPVLD